MKFVRWCIENTVPVNLAIIIFALLGLQATFNLQREAFPQFSVDVVRVSIATEGSLSPELVDKNIVEVVQPTLDGIDGISKINSIASRNHANFFLEIATGHDAEKIKRDIEDEVSSIANLPSEAKTPQVSLLKTEIEAIRVAIWSRNANQKKLFDEAWKLKHALKSDGIAQQIRWNTKNKFDLDIAVSPEALYAKNISFEELASQVQAHSFDEGIGRLISEDSSIFLKNAGRKTLPEDFLNIPIKLKGVEETVPLEFFTGKRGIQLAFEEESPVYRYNGSNAAVLLVEKSEGEDLIDLANRVKTYIENYAPPKGIQVTTFLDSSTFVQERIDLIVKNGYVGILLIVIILSLFLNGRTAFWVTMGVALSLIGSLVVLDFFDQSLNMISLFGLLITCGIIVDDAIVIGESYSLYRLKGLGTKESALMAFKEMSIPIFAMMSTTIVAFMPLFFISGVMGKFISVMPLAIVSALLISMLESLFILPAHLAHPGKGSFFRWSFVNRWITSPLRKTQKKIQKGLHALLKKILIPMTWFSHFHRYSVAILFTALFVFLVGLTAGGLIPTSLFPITDSEFYVVDAVLEEGVPLSKTEQVAKVLNQSLEKTIEEHQKESGINLVETFYMEVGSAKPNKCSLVVQLTSVDKGRDISGKEFIEKWRKNIPPIARLRSIEFGSKQAGPGGKPLALQLSSPNLEELHAAEKDTKDYLRSLVGVVDVGSTNTPGLPSIKVGIREGYRNLGFTEHDLVRSIQAAFEGITVDQFYTQESEVEVKVRLPNSERENITEVREFLLSNGMPVKQIAKVDPDFTASSIERINGQRALEVYGDIDESYINKANDLRKEFYGSFVPKLLKQYPSVKSSLSGESKDAQKSVQSLIKGYFPALLVIYLILATIFKSYIQPLIIMSVIPFGFVGAILGHLVLGISFNLMSVFGVIALTGIVVNDSLVFIDFSNKMRFRGFNTEKSLLLATKRRFRPILLTSITTIAGLAPILFETSFQAQFLIPMATTIVFGLGFSTLLIFCLIPAGYGIYRDLVCVTERLMQRFH